MNPEITEPEAATPAANAVSIFGQGGSPNDFPVLKAFQEYIDAEQAKARKRMLGLSVFFIVLLVVIVITFTLVVMSVINRNQSLSDRLLDIALREKSPAQPVVNVQSPAPAPVVQPVVHQPSQEESLKPVMEEYRKGTPLSSFLSSPTLLVYPQQNGDTGYGLECCCPWEPEHQCLILFRNDDVVYVGPSDMLDPWTDEEYLHCVWN